jgi:hypothetical protein
MRVFDDGSKTYIQMRPEIQNREAPRSSRFWFGRERRNDQLSRAATDLRRGSSV